MYRQKRTVTIKYDRLEYVSKSITVNEDEADEVYAKLKIQKDVRNLRRI